MEELETRALLAVVSGTVFTDLDGTDDGISAPDGIQTAADSGRVSETVELFTSGNVSMGVRMTDSAGSYEFDNVPAGDYYLSFTEPDGAFFTTKDAGGDDTLDSDVNSDGTTDVFTVAATDLDFDAGAVNQFSPAGFEYLLSQFGASLQNLLIQSEEFEDSVSDVSLVGENGIPFIEDALSSVVNFTSTFNEIGNQLFDSAVLALPSAPVVSASASEEAALLVSVNGATPVDVSIPTGMHADLTELVTFSNTALTAAGLDSDIVAGEADGGLTFSTLQNDLGTTLRIGTVRVTAPSSAPAYGQPLVDVTFDIVVDGDTTTLSLPATPTFDLDGNPLPTSQDNASRDELADDLNELFTNAGLTSVTAFVGGSDELIIAATGPEVSTLQLVDGSNLSALGFSAATADTNQGALDLGFDDSGLVGGRAAAGFRFNSINSLVNELDQALMNVADPGTGVSLGAVFDDATESILFTLGLGKEFSKDISLDFSEGIDLGALGTLEVAGGADATFTAGATIDVRAGFDLTGLGDSFVLTNATTLDSLNGGSGVQLNVGLKAANVAPSNGKLGANATLNVIINGQPAVPVTITAAATSTNTDELALVDDLNDALASAGLDEMISASSEEATIPNDGVEGRKVSFTALDPAVKSLRVESASALGFTGAGQDSDRADLTVSLRDGTTFDVNLDGSETIGDVITAIEQQSIIAVNPRVTVSINADQTGLELVDQTAGGNPFKVTQPTSSEGLPAIAGFALGILKSSTTDTIAGDTLHGESLLDRFFIVADESGLSIDANISATNIDLTAALSFLEIGFEGGTLDFDIGTGIDFTDPDSSGRLTLTEMFESSLPDLFDLVPLTATGSAELPLSESVFELVAPDYDVDNQDPAIEASISASLSGVDLSLGPNADLQTVFEDVIAQFADFGVDDLIALLSNLTDVLLDSDLPLLNENIPLIDQSIGDVIGFADSILAMRSRRLGHADGR